MEAQSYIMKYETIKRRKKNEENNRLDSKIDKNQNTANDEKRIKLEELEEELQKLDDERNIENARRYFAKNNFE